MNKKPTQFKGLYILENNYFNDDRGVFSEIWNQEKMLKNGLKNNFNQDNVSISKKNVIRGLHFQNQPHGQIKLVRVIKGKVGFQNAPVTQCYYPKVDSTIKHHKKLGSVYQTGTFRQMEVLESLYEPGSKTSSS